MKTKHLLHKHGGRIIAIHSVGHSTHKKVAQWFYIGDVEWKDGGKSVGTEIPPWAVCFDHDIPEACAEYTTVVNKLNAYLVDNGEWHNIRYVGDMAVSWTPKNK